MPNAKLLSKKPECHFCSALHLKIFVQNMQDNIYFIRNIQMPILDLNDLGKTSVHSADFFSSYIKVIIKYALIKCNEFASQLRLLTTFFFTADQVIYHYALTTAQLVLPVCRGKLEENLQSRIKSQPIHTVLSPAIAPPIM